MTTGSIRLRHLSGMARFGVACLVLVLLGGFAASATHLVWHYENRDDQPELTIDDFTGAYHGVSARAPLLQALDRAHPDGLAENDRATLLAWLGGERISEDYDNLDLGDAAPAEIIARECLDCHSRQASAGDGIGQTLPLDYWDDISAVAFSREVQPTSIEVLAASTHTHALSLGMLGLIVAALSLMTCWPRRLVNAGIAIMGVTLLADLAGWWLARGNAGFVPVLVGAGVLFNGVSVLLLLAVLVDLLLPGRAAAES